MIDGVVVREAQYHADSRGWLLKAVPREFIGENSFGEIYLSGAKPGEVKGIHYHKETTEWFCIIMGEGTLNLEDIRTGEKMTLKMNRENKLSVEIPPYVAHAILNSGNKEMVLLAFANIPYDNDKPDTIPWNFPDLTS
jgi:UDP-2-acetamido-2,6-beta-L-arabino-hexul-4-ose reductase